MGNNEKEIIPDFGKCFFCGEEIEINEEAIICDFEYLNRISKFCINNHIPFKKLGSCEYSTDFPFRSHISCASEELIFYSFLDYCFRNKDFSNTIERLKRKEFNDNFSKAIARIHSISDLIFEYHKGVSNFFNNYPH